MDSLPLDHPGAANHSLPARALLDEFLEAVPDSVYFKDRDGRFLAVSRSKALRHGFADRSKIVGLTDFDLFAAEHAQRSQAEEQEIMRTAEPIIGKLHYLIWPDGRQGWGLTSKLPLHDEQRVIVGTFGVTRDVTELKRVEEDLEKSRRALIQASHLAGMAEVATGILHNVGNVLNSLNVSAELVRSHVAARPLSRIGQVAELLRQNLPNLTQFLTEDPKGKLVLDYLDALAAREAPDQRQLLEELDAIKKHVNHIAEIVAMQQSYATVLALTEQVEAAEICDDAIQFIEASMTGRGIEIARDYQPCPPLVAQKGKLLQILVNFLQNAKHACAEAPPRSERHVVRIHVSPTDGGIRFSVSDTGVGISAADLDRLFQQGFTTRKNGHGFGLHSCAVAAKQMGGRVSAHSAGLGLGATFVLLMPLQPPDANVAVPPAPRVPNVEFVTRAAR